MRIMILQKILDFAENMKTIEKPMFFEAVGFKMMKKTTCVIAFMLK